MSNKLPRGWKEWDPHGGVARRPVECGDCGWEGFEDEVQESAFELDSILERVGPGEIMPVGSCPAIRLPSHYGEPICRALVHYSDVIVAWRKKPNVLEKIVEATE